MTTNIITDIYDLLIGGLKKYQFFVLIILNNNNFAATTDYDGEATLSYAVAILLQSFNLHYSHHYMHSLRIEVANPRKFGLRAVLVFSLSLFFLSTSVAQQGLPPTAGKAAVSGTVSTSDGKPAGFVTVGIRGQGSTQADEQGRFTLENIEAGTHTVVASYVGLQTQQQQVTAVAGGIAKVTFILYEDAQTLQEVVVNGERVNRFANKETEYVARMPLTNLENPQVYSVITKQLMQEQASFTIAESMRNAAGALPVINPSGGLSVFFRGFGTGINARNGMESTTERSAMDLANVERIEVLKGVGTWWRW